MHVGLIIYGRLETISGGYLYDRKLVDALRNQGHMVEVISLPWSSYGRHLFHNASRRLYQRLRYASFDLLLQDELNHPSLFWLNQHLRRHVSYPLVSIIHHLRSSEVHPAWQKLCYRWVEQRYLSTMDALIYNSQTTRAEVESLIGRAPPHIIAYPAGDRLQLALNPELITARAHEAGPLRLLFVGNLIRRKGLHTVLAALACLPGHDWLLTVVGDTTVDPVYTRAIERQVMRDGLSAQVTFCGSVTDVELAQRLARSQLLVVPSTYEGFGIVYLEGMAAGLPAVATTAGAAHEIISDGENGFLVVPGDAAALAQRFQCLHQDRRRLAQMSLAARQRFLLHPTWRETAVRICRFLDELVDDR